LNEGKKEMAKVGVQRAAELTGRSKSTIQRAMNIGKLSYETDLNGRRVVDVSELDRALGLVPQGVGAGAVAPVNNNHVEAEIKRATEMMEMERIKMRVKVLEDQLDSTREQLEDVKNQRDQWQKQAQQVLLTSQYSQKQAEDLQAELAERDRRAKLRRQQEIEARMKRLQGQNENVQKTEQAAEKAAFDLQGLWQKFRSNKKVA
jgi:vacuolar-type H+-ATPase subunit I/STV1